MRTILHADMDAFYAAIEQRDDPSLRGKPVIVGGAGRRGVVATASYEARRFGVHSALPGAIARRRCPDGIFVRPRMAQYAAVGAQIRAIFAEFTPLVEPLSLDEAFLDVTASESLFGDGPAIAREIKDRVARETELTVSVGVADSKFVAKVASDLDKPDGLVVVPAGEEAGFLAPLPVKRLWGAGPATQKKMHAFGINVIGDLQQLSRSQLAEWFGARAGEHYYQLCRGCDDRAVEPEREAKSISHETTFEQDVRDPGEIDRVLLGLSESVATRLRRHSLEGGVVHLKVRFPPFVTRTCQAKLDAPTSDDLTIYQQARAALTRVLDGRPRPIRLLGVGVSHLVAEDAPRQRLLFGRKPRVERRLNAAVDAIRERFGDDAICHGRADGRPGDPVDK